MTSKNKTAEVDAFMAELEHPFKTEVQAVRDIITAVHPNITEEIKWKAPTFSYKGYMVSFNLWARDRVHLVFHNGIVIDDGSGFLEGDYKDRRMAYFYSMDDIQTRKGELEKAVRNWIAYMDEHGLDT